MPVFETTSRWLSGTFDSKEAATTVNVDVVVSAMDANAMALAIVVACAEPKPHVGTLHYTVTAVPYSAINMLYVAQIGQTTVCRLEHVQHTKEAETTVGWYEYHTFIPGDGTFTVCAALANKKAITVVKAPPFIISVS